MSLIDLVREGRKRAGLTQVELARRAGVPQSTVGRIETGTRIPSTAMAERLIRAAGFELRIGLDDPDPGTDSLFEQTLRRTPRQRLADATRTAAAPSGGNAMAGERFDPVRMLTALQEAGVHFLLVGDMAATLHGDVAVPVDLAVVPERKPGNLDRLAIAVPVAPGATQISVGMRSRSRWRMESGYSSRRSPM
jgi:transcriptional regulator with XRE-family HTH domain